MLRRLPFLLVAPALAATLSLAAPANAQEPCDGSAPGYFPHMKVMYFPYYSPVIPVCERWYKKDCHGNEYLVPYYPGYTRWSPRFTHCPWGFHPCCPPGCGTGSDVGGYGVYTGARHHEESLLHLGGMGFSHPSPEGAPPDFIDMIRGNCGPGGIAPPPLAGAPAPAKTEGGETPAKKDGGPPPASR